MTPEIIYPVDMDDYLWWETENKGWLEVTIRLGDSRWTVTFYDPIRLAQDVAADLERQGHFAERIIVVPALTRDAVESAVRTLAASPGSAAGEPDRDGG